MAEQCQIYLLTPERFDIPVFCRDLAAALEAGEVAAVQYRPKGADDDTIVAAIEQIRPIVQSAGAAFILNDRPDLAAQTGCDGVHIGQEDAPYCEARRLLGPDCIIGVTCHNSRHLAVEAAERGADYVAFGAFYPSATKQAKTSAKPEILSWWDALMEVPCVAIGGISAENCGSLVRAGADFLAIAGAVWQHPDGPAAAIRALNAAIAEARRT